MDFHDAYQDRKPFPIVTHDGRVVQITPDQVQQHMRKLVQYAGMVDALTWKDVDNALTKTIKQVIGSDGEHYSIDDWDRNPQVRPSLREFQYIDFTPMQCIVRAIRYPNEHTMQVLKHAAPLLGKDLLKISTQGVDDVYANWLAVECQMYALMPYSKVKGIMAKISSTTFVDDIANIVNAFKGSFDKLNKLDVSKPMYEIRGHPDVAVTIISYYNRDFYYDLSCANGSISYSTKLPNKIVSLLLNADVLYHWHTFELSVRLFGVVFPRTDDLVKLGETTLCMYQSSI